MDSSELYRKKRELEREIHKLVAEFEVATDLVVSGITLLHEHPLGFGSWTHFVEIEAKVTGERGPRQ